MSWCTKPSCARGEQFRLIRCDLDLPEGTGECDAYLTYHGFDSYLDAFRWIRDIKVFIEQLEKSYRIPDWKDRILIYLRWDVLHDEYSIEIVLNEGPNLSLAKDVAQRFIVEFRVEYTET